jgi:anti-sigma-K factor RskA
MNCDEVNEAAGAYALGALPPEELREVEAHLQECNLHEEFASLRATATLLAFAPAEREPPPALRSRIMAAVASDGHPSAPIPFPVPQHEPRGIRPAYALAAALALLALGLLAWNLMLLRTDEGGPRQVFVPKEIFVTVTVEPTSLTRSVTTGPAAGTTLHYISDERVGVLNVSGLLPLGTGQIYQIWTLRGKDVTGVGLFNLNQDGTAQVAFSSPLNEGDTVAVTVEPAGGSLLPTSEPVFTIQI